MLRSRGSCGELLRGPDRAVDLRELRPLNSSGSSLGAEDNMLSNSRAVHRNASATHARPQSDPEAPPVEHGQANEPGSPKKSHLDIPSHRRKQPLYLMFSALGVAFTLGLLLYLSHDGSPGAVTPQSGRSVTNIRTLNVPGTTADGSLHNDLSLVEFSVPGLFVPAVDALDVDFPAQPQEATEKLKYVLNHKYRGAKIYERHRAESLQAVQDPLLRASGPIPGGNFADEEWPSPGKIRLLVAVTSACCSEVSFRRREAIRRTWGALTQERYVDGVDILFFLSQPADRGTLNTWTPILKEEIRRYNDTVILRGRDYYKNLPNKTFRMLRYFLLHPKEYTHVLKADDDTWVRMHRVFEALHEPDPERDPTGRAAMAVSVARRDERILNTAARLKAQLAKMSADNGYLILSDGMSNFDASNIVEKSKTGKDGYDGNSTVDDVDGRNVNLEDLLQRAENANGDDILNDVKNAAKHKPTLVNLSKSKIPLAPPRMSGVYMGCVEIPAGFQPIRDPSSKWYISRKELPDDDVPWGVTYLAGWGYVLSRDVALHVMKKVDAYESSPEEAPLWFQRLHWEDVLVGLLVADIIPNPESHASFRPAWRSCHADTAVRHLDVDSPRLLAGLVAQDVSGLSDEKAVQCSSGQFLPGDYNGWYAWRTSLEGS